MHLVNQDRTNFQGTIPGSSTTQTVRGRNLDYYPETPLGYDQDPKVILVYRLDDAVEAEKFKRTILKSTAAQIKELKDSRIEIRKIDSKMSVMCFFGKAFKNDFSEKLSIARGVDYLARTQAPTPISKLPDAFRDLLKIPFIRSGKAPTEQTVVAISFDSTISYKQGKMSYGSSNNRLFGDNPNASTLWNDLLKAPAPENRPATPQEIEQLAPKSESMLEYAMPPRVVVDPNNRSRMYGDTNKLMGEATRIFLEAHQERFREVSDIYKRIMDALLTKPQNVENLRTSEDRVYEAATTRKQPGQEQSNDEIEITSKGFRALLTYSITEGGKTRQLPIAFEVPYGLPKR